MLESVERQTGKRQPELDGPELPLDVAHIWRWFVEIAAGRGSNGWGPNPISYLDIDAWARLTGTIMRPTEVRAIVLVDQTWRGQVSKAQEARQNFLKQQRQQQQHGR